MCRYAPFFAADSDDSKLPRYSVNLLKMSICRYVFEENCDNGVALVLWIGKRPSISNLILPCQYVPDRRKL